MTHSTVELTRDRQFVCSHCVRPTHRANRYRRIEMGLAILALAAMASILLPLGFVTWKACTNLLTSSEWHSILFQPLEDWTRY
jgi:hypothetical protein